MGALTNERLYSGNLAQVLQQLMNWVIVLWSDGILMIQQQLTGQKKRVSMFAIGRLKQYMNSLGTD